MFVHLARQSHFGVILRRGPTDWWRLTLWDTVNDCFEDGQWFRGRIYPEKCDVSPDGRLFVYFGGKFSRRAEAKGYRTTWTAVSRPPYLTALALWPIGDTWGGSAIFPRQRDSATRQFQPGLAETPSESPARPTACTDLRRFVEQRSTLSCNVWRATRVGSARTLQRRTRPRRGPHNLWQAGSGPICSPPPESFERTYAVHYLRTG